MKEGEIDPSETKDDDNKDDGKDDDKDNTARGEIEMQDDDEAIAEPEKQEE